MSEMLTQISTCWWMHYVCSKENIEDLGTDGRHQDGVDSGQLHVDLEAEIGEGLWGGFVDVFNLHALCHHSQVCVSYTLHLGVHGALSGENDHNQLCVKKINIFKGLFLMSGV